MTGTEGTLKMNVQLIACLILFELQMYSFTRSDLFAELSLIDLLSKLNILVLLRFYFISNQV